MKRHKWTETEINWLSENISGHSWKDIEPAFNEHFGTNLSQASIEHACLRHGITHGRKNEKGFIAGEHNRYSITQPLFSERTDSRGRVFVKIKNDACDFRGNWVQKDRYIWEQQYGKLTKNDLLIHLNQDKSDCSIDNLYKVDRKINRMLSSFGWFFTDRIMMITAIKCCELLNELNKERENNDKV